MKALAILLLLNVAAADPRLAVGLDEHVGARIPLDTPLTDTTGRATTLRSLLAPDRPIILALAYARCEMLCSVVLRALADAVRAHPGPDYLPVVVSLDPDETADEGARRQNRLLDDIGRAGQRAAWPYLVGDAPAIAELANALGFRYAWDPETRQFAHPAVVFVLTPDGRIAEYLRGVTFVDSLPLALVRARAGELTPSTARDLLTCFHFDPTLRRREHQLRLVFQLGAALVLFTLAAMIAGLVAWERRRLR